MPERAPRKKIEHINYAISAKRHTPIYLMHKYWARKPHNVVAEYIKHYSQEDEVVLDPFCGSGVTLIEALRCGRKAIAVDLDPVATFITRMSAILVDLDEFEKSFEIIKDKTKHRIETLYLTKCPKCGKETPIHYIVFEGSIPQKIHLRCPSCRLVLDKSFTEDDRKRAEEIKVMEIPYWYPKNELIWNSRVNVPKGMKVSDLFSKRNLIALSIILHEIEKIEDDHIRDLMKFAFSSTIPQASKLLVYTEGSGPSWKVRGYWIPKKRWEMNVWRFFENRFRSTLKGKRESNEIIGKIFEEGKTAWIFTQSAIDLSNVPNSSVDYVFTDPPYGDSVPFLELDYVYASWLKFNVNFEDEIIISDSPVRKDKNFEMYYKMLARAFREVYRVLKAGKWVTVTFHNTDIKIYNAIIRAVVLAGFDLEKIVYQPPATVSAKAQLAPYGSAKGDYYIRFRKTRRESLGLTVYSEINKQRYERIIVDTVKKIIGEQIGEPTPYSALVNSYPIIYNELKKNGYLFSAPEGIEEILKRNLNREFALLDVRNQKGKVIGQKWWVKGVKFLDRVPLSDRVEAVTVNVLNREIKVSFDDVLRQVYLKFTNALTPDTQSVKRVLEEYAEKTKDKKWRLKPKVRQRESEHDSIVEMLAVLGKKAGFEVYADLSEWRGALELNLPQENLDRIKEIDVVWYNEGEITYEFEVENTTGITEAIVRGSNIPSTKTKRYIVIPEERQDFFYRKIAEPMLKEKVDECGWQFIFYDALRTFHERNKGKEEIKLSEFEKLGGAPSLRMEKQQMIQDFLG